MSATQNAKDDAFLLGKIEATVSGTADDVRAIRTELGELSRRQAQTEATVTGLVAERKTQVDEWTKWRHKISNEVQGLVATKHEQQGAVKGVTMAASITKVLLGVAISAAGFFGFHYATAPKVAKSEVTVERSVSVPAH